jgi:transcriptional regulator of acetoin/glycerol metabolism
MQGEGRPTEITTNAFRRILARAWPFNVRQLNQTLATAALLAGADGTITADALAEILDQDDGLPQNPDEVRRLRAELVGHLSKHEGDTHEVARAMGRDIYQIKRWLERFALQAENYRI